MNILIFGGAGLLGGAIAQALRVQGHRVTTAGRSGCDERVDFAAKPSIAELRQLVRGADVVVNAVGILIERASNTFDAVHVHTPSRLFEACTAERVARIVQISALGVGQGIAGRYMQSKLQAEQALIDACRAPGVSTDAAIVRPGLLIDEAAPSTRLFRWLAKLPVWALPGLMDAGESRVSVIAAQDAALAIAKLCTHPKALHRAVELPGETMTYRELLQRFRGGGVAPIRIPVPWWLMHLTARIAEAWPQKVFSRDTVRMLQAGLAPEHSSAAAESMKTPPSLPKPAPTLT